jgi:hypothetical protein
LPTAGPVKSKVRRHSTFIHPNQSYNIQNTYFTLLPIIR